MKYSAKNRPIVYIKGLLMSINKALHSKDDMNRLYVSSKLERRELRWIEDTAETLIRRLEDYKKKKKKKKKQRKTNYSDPNQLQ